MNIILTELALTALAIAVLIACRLSAKGDEGRADWRDPPSVAGAA